MEWDFFCGEIIGAKLIFLKSARSSVACYHVPLFLRPETFRDPNMTSANFRPDFFEQFAPRKKARKMSISERIRMSIKYEALYPGYHITGKVKG